MKLILTALMCLQVVRAGTGEGTQVQGEVIQRLSLAVTCHPPHAAELTRMRPVETGDGADTAASLIPLPLRDFFDPREA